MTNEERIEGLERRIDELTTQVGILEDTQAIRNLQHKYGYYMDKAFYEAVVDLFSDDCEIRFMGGLFRGKAGAKRLFVDRFRAKFAGGTEGPKPGLLMEHIQLQDIIDVAPDRKTAKARFRYFMQGGMHYSAGEARQWWEGGLYENVYVKDNGTWKIKVIIPKMVYIGDFEHGWAYTKPHLFAFFEETYPKDPIGPDELCPQDRVAWPDTDVLWYHYPHPVTGAKTGMGE